MFERTWTIANVGTSADSVTIDKLALPGGEPELALEAWQSGNGLLPALVFDGILTTTECEDRATLQNGPVDALMAVPEGGRGRVRFPYDIGGVTVFFPFGNAAGEAQFVTIKICEVPRNAS